MPVYHFTYHAYRSWNADHPEGWHQHGEVGRQRPQPRLGDYRNRIANHAAMEFSEDQQKLFLALLHDICGRHGWRFHCVGMDPTHLHPVVSWRESHNSDEVRDRLKNLLSLLLNRHEQAVGRRVFSKKSGDTRVFTKKHLNYLKTVYLPKHSGLFWCEPNP
jgi:REP element-mobilizing transposase RayT